MYIGDYLGRRASFTPCRLAVVDVTGSHSMRLTYADLNDRANRLANWLRSNGVEKGDRVGMLSYDGLPFYDAFFACGKLGAVFTPYNWRLHAREIESQIRLTTPKHLIASLESPMGDIVEDLRTCDNMPEILPLTPGDRTGYDEALREADASPATCEALIEEDTSCLLFTGGTTGAPKAAQISHRQVAWNTFNANLGDVQGTDVFINIFPMFHAGGLFAFTIPILIQGGVIIQTKRFVPAQILELVEIERATIFGGVPTVFQMLAAAPNWDGADLSSLRYCLSGGAAMPVSLIQKYREEKGVVFRQGFGMTEFGPDVFSLAAEDAVRKAGSIGKPNFFVDARVVDSRTNRPLASGEIGEMVLRGPVATTGYFNNPEATASAFDDENYFHTGDLAYIDEDGYFFIVDRLKDMFTSGGENVYPAEIEAAIYKHPDVQMCAVVGMKDEKWGEVGCAFVVLKEQASMTEDALISFLAENLAKYKVPKRVVLKKELPVSGAGKILKTELRKGVMNDE